MTAYPRERVESWVDCWLICRANGLRLPGPPHCNDRLCGVDRGRWELVDGPFGKHYVCRHCRRFIGYPTPPTSPRRKPR